MTARNHLSPGEVLKIIDFMDGSNPIVVGGQSINIWAQHYSQVDPDLAKLGTLTSKDVDFFNNKTAVAKLAASLARPIHDDLRLRAFSARPDFRRGSSTGFFTALRTVLC